VKVVQKKNNKKLNVNESVQSFKGKQL